MDKEILTADDFKRMERRDARTAFFIALILLPLLIVQCLLFRITPKALIVDIVTIIWLVPFGLITLVCLFAPLITYLKPTSEPIIVRAKQSTKKETGKRAILKKLRHELDEDYAYVLRFEHYGEYVIPDRVFGFSEYGEMTGKELWDCTYPEDEFYLLLNKKNVIIGVFPCNMFEYVGKLTQHTIVNGEIQR